MSKKMEEVAATSFHLKLIKSSTFNHTIGFPLFVHINKKTPFISNKNIANLFVGLLSTTYLLLL